MSDVANEPNPRLISSKIQATRKVAFDVVINPADLTVPITLFQLLTSLAARSRSSIFNRLRGPLLRPASEARSNSERCDNVNRTTQLLDFDAIATGPAKTTGMGPQYKPHMILDWTFQGLRDHPGVGVGLISVALKSPSVQSRNDALNAFDHQERNGPRSPTTRTTPLMGRR